jgi:hypothetical protein
MTKERYDINLPFYAGMPDRHRFRHIRMCDRPIQQDRGTRRTGRQDRVSQAGADTAGIWTYTRSAVRARIPTGTPSCSCAPTGSCAFPAGTNAHADGRAGAPTGAQERGTIGK